MQTAQKIIKESLAVYQFPPFGLCGSTLQPAFERLEGGFMFAFLLFEQSKPFANNFTGGLVTAGGYTSLHEFFQLGRQRHIET